METVACVDLCPPHAYLNISVHIYKRYDIAWLENKVSDTVLSMNEALGCINSTSNK